MSVSDRALAFDNRKKHEAACRELQRLLPNFASIRLAIGEQLLIIHDAEVWKETHKTLEAFFLETFGLDRSYAYRLMDAAKVTKNLNLSPIGDKAEVPKLESQLREVAKAPAELQAEVVRKAVEKAAEENRKPTASDYKKVVGELLSEAEQAEQEELAAEEEEEEPINDEPTIEEICEGDNKKIESFCRAIVKQFQDDVPKLPWTQDSGRIDSAIASLKAGLTTLRGAKAEVCPACVEGMTEKGKCRYCKGHGYLPTYQAKAVPEDARL